VIEAVVFDLDGVLVQSEELWDAARRDLVSDAGLEWPDDATEAMMGMSSPEWSAYVHDEIGLDMSPEDINAAVVERLEARYRSDLPWIPGAQDAVRRMAAAFPLGLATSSNREIIDIVMELGGFEDLFQLTVSSEEVARGKPAPDVYLEAARRLGVEPANCAAVEDSHGGIRSAKGARMRVLAIPNPTYPPDEESLAQADVVLRSLAELTPERVHGDV
jgi:HAD superfamily hydrolase (TIGR01509 family)